MTNKGTYEGICKMLDDESISDDYKVALWRAEYVFKKLIRMENDLAEEYVDLLDVDFPRRDDYWDGYNTGYHDCEVEQQAEEKKERPQGIWKYQDHADFCSNCGKQALELEEYPFLSNYCPFCGAEMEIEDDGSNPEQSGNEE